ncbi:MAG: hypothetical protein ACEPOZ_07230 [Marinifilaceae bacterium]
MKPRLLLLSDLWGKSKSAWKSLYLDVLATEFDIQYYDCCVLGKINTTDIKEEVLHTQYVNHGIETAVENLLKLETGTIDILAFSIGGSIAWKAGIRGLKIRNLYAVSSTRLRFETETPDCSINLWYGEKDSFRPNSKWLKKLKIDCKIEKAGDHLIYTDKDFSERVCEKIIENHKSKF